MTGVSQDQSHLSALIPRQRTAEPGWLAEPVNGPEPAPEAPRRKWISPRILTVAAIAVFGIVVRVLLWLENRPLWLDEQLIGFNLRDRGYQELIGRLWNECSAPIGWLWAQRFVVEAFGHGELALRFIPLLSGVATVIAAGLVARRFFGPAGAIALTGLVATSFALVVYSAELKHYATDAFFSMTLLGLGLWILHRPEALRRWVVWWLVASAGALISMGGFLVVPGIFLVLMFVLWRQEGWRAALRAWAPGLIWFAAFLANYVLALRATATSSSYLQMVWARGLMPAGAGPDGIAVWIAKRFGNLAEDPIHAGAGLGEGRAVHLIAGGPFWLLVLIGLIVAWRRRPALALLVAAPLISGFLLAMLRVVPLMARLSHWIVPALFLAVAFAADGAYHAARHAFAQRHRFRLAGSVLVLLSLVMLIPYAKASIGVIQPAGDTDDRAGVAYIREQFRPGDIVFMTANTHQGLSWYAPGLAPSATVLSTPDRKCPGELAKRVQGHKRVLTYAGAAIGPWVNTPAATLAELESLGKVVTTQRFAGTSVVWIVDLTLPPDGPQPNGDCVYIP